MLSAWILPLGIGSAIITVSVFVLWFRCRSIQVSPLLLAKPGRFDSLLAERMKALGLDFEKAERELSVKPKARGPRPPVTSPETVLAGAAVVDGLVPVVDMLSRWASVDTHVFQAVSHLTHSQVDSFTDLMKVVEAKGYAIETPGFLNLLVGHVGEWHAQEHLSQAGLAVSMPWSGTEPGLDIWINGVGVNVKTVADAGQAASHHFADYPGIPILVPVDSTHIPEGALHFDPTHAFDPSALAGSDHLVMVDQALNHAQVVEQSQHAASVLQDPGPHLQFPWVTFAISSLRETRLLIRGSTDFSRAAKNVAVDTAIVGGSVAAGAKMGAGIGFLFGPVGMVVGTVAGGMAAGLAGRHYANRIKRQPLHEAKEKYDSALRRYQEMESATAAEVGGRWERLRDEEQARLRTALSQLSTLHQSRLLALKAQLEQPLRLPRDTALKFITNIRGDVQTWICHKMREIDPDAESSILDLIFNPTRWMRARALRREELAWNAACEALISAWESTPEQASQLFDCLMAVPTGEAIARDYAEQAIHSRSKGYAMLKESQKSFGQTVQRLRAASVTRLHEGWNEIHAEAGRKIAPLVESLKRAVGRLETEVKKAGLHRAA